MDSAILKWMFYREQFTNIRTQIVRATGGQTPFDEEEIEKMRSDAAKMERLFLNSARDVFALVEKTEGISFDWLGQWEEVQDENG